MTATKSQKIRLGVFAVSAAAAVALVVILFAGLRFWEKYDRYVVYFEDTVLGLEDGAVVTFAGIKVGSVVDIRVAPDDLRKVRVTVKVKRGTPVRTDTTATLTMAGITGLKTIDLKGGDFRAAHLPPGGTLTPGEGMLDRLERQAKTLVDESHALLGNANKVLVNLAALTEPGQFDGLGEIMDSAKLASGNLAAVSTDLRTMLGENRAPIRRTVASIEKVAARAGTMMDTEVPKMVGNVGTIVDNAGNLVEEVRGVVRDNQSYIRSSMFDLRQASRSFKDLARDLRQRPSRLFFAGAAGERKMP